MIMMKIGLLLALAARRAAECISGCLKCNSNDQCLFCDFQNNYYLLGSMCQIFTFDNCVMQNTVGTCIACAKNFVLDFNTNKCVAVPTSLIIPNCVFYLTTSTCGTCDANFIVQNGKCSAVATAITGCVVNDSVNIGNCLQCKAGTVLALNASACVPPTTVPNCASYNHITCSTCANGFFLNPNKYQDDLYTVFDETSRFQLKTKLAQDSGGLIDQMLYASCSTILVSNCLAYYSHFNCSLCAAGYFRDTTGACVPYPSESVPNCRTYSAANVCTDCASGNFLLNSTACMTNVPISNCISYATNLNTTTCIKCGASFFLSSNACVARANSVSITKCIATSPNADVCSACETGFVLTTDALACLTDVANCQTLSPSTKNTQSLSCVTCQGGYYLDQTGICTLGTVPNCAVYQPTTNACTTCLNGFYLVNSLSCVAQTPIANCATFDSLSNGVCTSCLLNNILFSRTNGCVAVTPVGNCTVYNSTSTCSQCASGFFLANATLCSPITSIPNCLQLNAGVCTACSPDYYISSANACLQPDAYFNLNCLQNNVNGAIYDVQLTCQQCATGTLPMNYTNSSVCVTASLLGASAISGCLKYALDSSGYSCSLCDSGMAVSGSSCVASCPDGFHLRPFIVYQGSYTALGSTTVDYFFVRRSRVCVSTITALAGCAQSFPELFTNPSVVGEPFYYCSKCQNNYYPVVNASTAVFWQDMASALIASPLSAYPGVSCVAPSNPALLLVANCLYYYSDAASSSIVCLRCAFGYTGPVGANRGISSCSALVQYCNTAVYLFGLTQRRSDVVALKTVWETYYSCHSCANGYLPFVALNFATNATAPIPSYIPYSLVPAAGATYTAGTSVTANTVNCLDVTSSGSPNFGVNPSSFSFPANCALGAINVAGTGDASQSAGIAAPDPLRSSVYCTACAPGYMPSYVTNNAQVLMIYACTLIANCNMGNGVSWFNSCSNCNNGYAYDFNFTSKTVNYSSCLLFPDNNCWASYLNATSNARVCVLCDPGYSLNLDGVCELINAPRCIVNQFTLAFPVNLLSSEDRRGTGLFLAPTGAGCQRCDSGFVALRRTYEEWVCTNSTYFAQQQFATPSLLSTNCINYAYDLSKKIYRCVTCAANFIPTTAGQCVSVTGLNNCVTAQLAGVCSVCATGFANIAGLCQVKNITNCLSYNEGAGTTVQTCAVCAAGFYPSGSLCVVGSVLNCQIMTSNTKCSACLPGFSLANVQNGVSYCFAIDAALNCLALSNKLDVNVAECSTCAAGFFLSTVTTAFNRTLCLPISPLPNCLNFTYAPQLSASSLNCAACASGFFLNSSFRCVARAVQPRNCIAYSPTADACSGCTSGYYTDATGANCVAFPAGVKGCTTYFNASVCTSCGPNRYLFNNTCVAVDVQLPNCVLYTSATVCANCTAGYSIFNGACVASQATNCQIWQSATACATCYKGFGLQNVNGVVNCVQKTDSKCLVSDDVFPFTCRTCTTLFYSLNGVCQPVNLTIANCSVYDTNVTCRNCISGFVLHSNKSACINDPTVLARTDAACLDNRMAPSPVCTKCASGYYFFNGTCTACPTAPTAGCYQCSPYTPSVCLLCSPGFYQNYLGACVKNSVIQMPTTTTPATSPNNTSNNTTNVTVLAGRALCSGVALALLLAVI